MNTLNRDDIMSVCDLRPKYIEVPEWSGCVWIKQMTAAERISLEELLSPEKKKNRSGLEIITLFLCRVLSDSDGNLLFTDDDAPELAKKNPEVLMRINDIAQEHNGMGKAAMEKLEKNSTGGPSAASPSS